MRPGILRSPLTSTATHMVCPPSLSILSISGKIFKPALRMIGSSGFNKAREVCTGVRIDPMPVGDVKVELGGVGNAASAPSRSKSVSVLEAVIDRGLALGSFIVSSRWGGVGPLRAYEERLSKSPRTFAGVVAIMLLGLSLKPLNTRERILCLTDGWRWNASLEPGRAKPRAGPEQMTCPTLSDAGRNLVGGGLSRALVVLRGSV